MPQLPVIAGLGAMVTHSHGSHQAEKHKTPQSCLGDSGCRRQLHTVAARKQGVCCAAALHAQGAAGEKAPEEGR